jgi:hypothetical protein
LGFAQDNDWAQFVNAKPTRNKERLLPLKMSPEEVFAYISIMNPELEEEQKKDMLEKLYHDNKWT